MGANGAKSKPPALLNFRGKSALYAGKLWHLVFVLLTTFMILESCDREAVGPTATLSSGVYFLTGNIGSKLTTETLIKL
jgi:hypothetical protein